MKASVADTIEEMGREAATKLTPLQLKDQLTAAEKPTPPAQYLSNTLKQLRRRSHAGRSGAETARSTTDTVRELRKWCEERFLNIEDPWPVDNAARRVKVVHFTVTENTVVVLYFMPKFITAFVDVLLKDMPEEGAAEHILQRLQAEVDFSSRICWQGYHVGACTTKLARWVDDCDQANLKRWRGTEVNLMDCLADAEAHLPANFLLQYSRAAVMKEFVRRGVRLPIPLWAYCGRSLVQIGQVVCASPSKQSSTVPSVNAIFAACSAISTGDTALRHYPA